MGHKIFVSYKYADSNVQNLSFYQNSTVRDYVTEFEGMIDSSSHIYKGESDGEDLSALSESTIWNKLRDRIYDSTLTIVFISPNMKDENKKDKDQWIPWEISYSLKEMSRKNSLGQSITSKTNAMLAVVLPDSYGDYSYYLEDRNCCASHCVTHHTDKLFQIIRDNKFNRVDGQKRRCDTNGETIWSGGNCSYITAVKWCDFIRNIDYYINQAYERQNAIDDYLIEKR